MEVSILDGSLTDLPSRIVEADLRKITVVDLLVHAGESLACLD